MLCGAIGIAALQQQKREPIVCARERAVELERPPIMANRFVEAAGLGEGDRHVLKNPRVVGVIAQRQSIGRQRGVIIPLTFQG